MSGLLATTSFALAMCVSALTSAAQQQRIDSAFLRKLVREAVAATATQSQVDTVAQSVLLRAASLQVGLSDLNGALHTATIVSQTPAWEPTLHHISRQTVC